MKRTAVGVLIAAVLFAACSGTNDAATTLPAPATEAEMATFCAQYDVAKDVGGIQELEMMLEVAPAEIRPVLVRLTGSPSEGFWDDVAAYEEFTERCDTEG